MKNNLDLDNIEAIKQADPSGYLSILKNTPDDIRRVWDEFKAKEFPTIKFDKIIVCAMGGSAIGADMAKFLVEKYSTLPMQIVRDYHLPNWVDDKTLAIVISYSGNTEETISGYLAARNRGAHIFCLASGGKLLELTQKDHFQHFILPPNMPPRTAWGHSFFVVLELLIKLKILNNSDIDLTGSISEMEEAIKIYQESTNSPANPAKEFALKLVDRLPFVYGAEHLSAVARRLKGEFNENSKIPASYDEIPELNHNAQQGLECAETIKKIMPVIIFDSPLYHERNHRRAKVIAETFSQQGFDILKYEIPGINQTRSICHGVIFGDYLSVYLAFLLGHDPVPFTAIEELKGLLKTGEYVQSMINEQ